MTHSNNNNNNNCVPPSILNPARIAEAARKTVAAKAAAAKATKATKAAAATAAAAAVVAALESPSAPVAVSSGKSSANKKKLMAQMVKAAGQRQHWKEAIVLFDQMQEKVLVHCALSRCGRFRLRPCFSLGPPTT